jgi:hypothetical protein
MVTITLNNDCAEIITMPNVPWFILDSNERDVYSPFSIKEITLLAGQKYSWTWDQKDNPWDERTGYGRDPRQVPPGTYMVVLGTDSAGAYFASFEIQAINPFSLKRFDVNNNERLDDLEFFVAIDQWVDGRLGDELFFAAIDAWVSQKPMEGSSALLREPIVLGVHDKASSVTFVVRSSGISSVRVDVFDLSGQRIFTGESAGARLIWNLSTLAGQPVANGVYLYVVTVRGTDGRELRSNVKKLMVLK